MKNIEAEIELLSQSLYELPEPVSNSSLIIISGLPGTGKSFFSRKLAERLPCVIIESDAIRKIFFHTPVYTVQENKQLFALCHKLMEHLLQKGFHIVFDATNLVEQHRERLYRIAHQQESSLIIVRTRAPVEIVRDRLRNRNENLGGPENSDADWNIYQMMQQKEERIGRNHYCVDTSDDIRPIIDNILQEVKR